MPIQFLHYEQNNVIYMGSDSLLIMDLMWVSRLPMDYIPTIRCIFPKLPTNGCHRQMTTATWTKKDGWQYHTSSGNKSCLFKIYRHIVDNKQAQVGCFHNLYPMQNTGTIFQSVQSYRLYQSQTYLGVNPYLGTKVVWSHG